jgi:hypothetical protein
MITTPFTELDDEERDQLNIEDRRIYNEIQKKIKSIMVDNVGGGRLNLSKN